jgi:gliding motility-associated-like protein
MIRLILILFLFLSCATALVAQEICDNGIDDDLDGLVDLNDSADCKCDLVRSYSIPSLVPNASFEAKYSCPVRLSQLDLLVAWSQASRATSDFFDTCGYTSYFKNPPNPLPDGSGYVGFLDGYGPGYGSYKEYLGTCLSDTMHAGVSYRMEVSMAHSFGKMGAKLAIFGSEACRNLPFGGNDAHFGCPTNGPGWVALDSVDVLLNSDSWTKVVFNFIPSTNITAIAIGPSCELTPSKNYYFLDNLVLNTKSSFVYKGAIEDSGYFCANNLQLKIVVNFTPNSYQWYKNGIALVGDTFKILRLEAGDTGLYAVRVSDSLGCALSPPFEVVESTQILAETDATKGCESLKKLGEINISNIRGGAPPYTFSLDDGSFSSLQNFKLLPPKTYEIVIRDSLFCTDTIQVLVDTIFTPKVVLPPDSIFCDSINAVLLPNTNISDVNYLWNTQDTTTAIEVKEEGLYWLKVENECGFDTDSIDLSVGYFTPQSTIGNDSIFCDEMPNILLQVGTENNGESYVWSDGSDKNELSIKEPGEYSITIENRCGSANDTVNYRVIPSPMIHLGIDTALCGVFSYRLDAGLDSMNYLWEPNGESSRIIYASQQGFYRVTVTDENGCEGVGEMEITDSCKSYLFMPNAFSPNGDGLNDRFVPVFKNISEYDLAIYSRWGEKLFVSEDQSNHWDGTYKDKAVQSGYYIYTLSYKELESVKWINSSGVVYLLR